MNQRGQLTTVERLKPGSDIVVDEDHSITVTRVHPSQGRVPADGNRMMVVHTLTTPIRMRKDQVLRVHPSSAM